MSRLSGTVRRLREGAEGVESEKREGNSRAAGMAMTGDGMRPGFPAIRVNRLFSGVSGVSGYKGARNGGPNSYQSRGRWFAKRGAKRVGSRPARDLHQVRA